MPLIKFCGITRLDDALEAAALGVDFLGFVLVQGSSRCVAPSLVREIRSRLPPRVETVVLVQDADPARIAEMLEASEADFVQFHGNEQPAPCEALGRPYFKAVPMGEGAAAWSEHEAAFPGAMALVADSHRRVLRAATAGERPIAAPPQGGTGKAFDWAALPTPAARRRPLMLAGGLTPETVGAGIAATRPWAVDVSTGIEAAGGPKGVKDALRMRAFVAAVRAAELVAAEAAAPPSGTSP